MPKAGQRTSRSPPPSAIRPTETASNPACGIQMAAANAWSIAAYRSRAFAESARGTSPSLARASASFVASTKAVPMALTLVRRIRPAAAAERDDPVLGLQKLGHFRAKRE